MKKITPQRLKNIALYYLERYDAGTVKLRGVLTRRIKKAQMEIPVPDEAFEWVEQVIEQMQNLGYVNDTRYAENMVRRLSQSGKSKTFIKNKLKMEGISESTFETLFSDTDDLTQARLFVRKKRLGQNLKKDLAKLARAGFSYDIARQALNQPKSDDFLIEINDKKRYNKNMFEELEKIKSECQNCMRCPLGKTRTKVVFSAGVPNSDIVLIGEAPGYNEDMTGEPFVGRAGQLLDKILESVGFSRKENIYICNTIKCRPPDNRDPLPEEKSACREYLNRQLDCLRPKIILLCGRVALTSFIETKQGISKIRGHWFDGPNGAKMMPIFHPSYLLRNPSHKEGSPKWLMWQDMKEIRRVYDELKTGLA